MREIKFRFYCQVCERFVLADIRHSYKHGLSATCDNHSVYTECYINQYTGLKDKNGVEIYESDIYEWYKNEHENEIGKIIFKDACFKCESGKNLHPVESMKINIKVIGNLHENPELLKEQK